MIWDAFGQRRQLSVDFYVQVAQDYNVGVYLDVVTVEPGTGYCAGRNIFLGPYDREDLRCITFFHELGHIVSELPPPNLWPYRHYHEALAWRVGLDIAWEYNVRFSLLTLGWASWCLSTYFEAAHEDASPAVFFREALEEAGLPSPEGAYMILPSLEEFEERWHG